MASRYYEEKRVSGPYQKDFHNEVTRKNFFAQLFLLVILPFAFAFLPRADAQTITGLSPNTGAAGTSITVSGTGFGSTQGASTATFNGTNGTPSNWNDTSIVVPVPSGATTGNVVVTVGGVASNGVNFTVVIPGFSPTGSLATARMFHTATLLNSGGVLVVGGVDGFTWNPITSGELYNTATGTFSPSGSLNNGRIFNTATLLTNGKVLVAGGADSNWNNIAPAEIYDPASGSFSLTASLNDPRNSHTATLLGTGKVLIVGGVDSNGNNITSMAAACELYDLASGTFTATGSLNVGRDSHTATLLNNGKVLIVGGMDINFNVIASAELYDPTTGTFTLTGNLNAPRAVQTAALLNNGMVLIAGGYDNNGNAVTTTEVYDPSTGTFSVTGDMNTARYDGPWPVALLGNGSVLIAGGQDNNGNTLATAELYDPVSGSFALTGSMSSTRQSLTETLLKNGRVLVVGGMDYNANVLASAELYQPATLVPTGLVSIALTPSSPSIAVGTSQALNAIGTFSNGSTENLASAAWSSSDSTIVTISNDITNDGTALGIAAGSATVSACLGSICGSTAITVTTPLSISNLSPAIGPVGAFVTITGTNFGPTQGSSTVTFNGVVATPTTWGGTSIVVPVPTGASTGNVVVTVGGQASNGMSFSVLAPSPLLKLRVADSPGEVNLSDPINTDWIVWGGDPQSQQGGVGVTRKSGASQISDVTFVSSTNTSYDQSGTIRFSWDDGSPVLSAVNSTPELWADAGTSIQLSAPADTSVRTLKLYVGLWGPTKIDATLSDGSVVPVSTTMGDDVSGTDEVFSLDYRAASSGQTITVTITALPTDGFFDLYAASLEPHVPEVSILSPSSNQSGINSSVNTVVDAQQFDFGIANVGLSADGGNLFNFTQPPYSSTWSNISPGHHTLTATATDTNGLTGTSAAVEFDVLRSGGSLNTTVQDIPSTVDLTQEGTADWRAWVVDSSGNPASAQKAGVVPQISDATLIGNHLASTDGTPNGVSFLDGTPYPVQTGGVVGEEVFNGTIGTGFELKVAADPNQRTLRLYAGVGWADAKLVAFLSDGSAPVLVDTSISSPNSEIVKVYTINYQAASPNQSLTVRLTLANSYDYGNVSLFAATLQGPVQSTGPSVTTVVPAGVVRSGDPVTIYGTGFGQQQGSNQVTVNGAQMTVTSWSPYRIDAVVSCEGQLTVDVNGTTTNSLRLPVINIVPDGTSIQLNGGTQLQFPNSCGTLLTGGYWQVTGGINISTISNPAPGNPYQSYDVAPTLTGIAPGVVTVTYYAADSTTQSSTINVIEPTISSVSVSGTQVTISGSDFGTSQSMGYAVLSNLYGLVVSWSDTQIVVNMQQGTLSGYLYVHQYGLDSNALPFTSSWSPSNPAIASLSPTSGTAGDSVSINGANFGYSQLGSTVTFNGVQANVSSWSNSSIVVQVPHSAATGNVLVTVGGVPSNGVSFTVLAPVIASLSPNAGAVGAAVTIAGTKFGQYQGSSFVYFNGSTANVTAWSDTSITVTVPNYATTGDVVVYRTAAIGFGTVLNSTSSNGVPFTVTSNPIINGLSSNSGLPGKVITISGSNFGWDQTVGTVTFNGTAAVPTSWSPTAITTTVPSGATSGNVVVTVNGVASNGVNFTVPSLTSISIAPNNPSVAVGSTQQFRATGSYSDGSTQSIGTANWTSSATSVASINGAGNATAVAQGQTVVQATVGGVVGSTTLTVTTTMGNFASTGNLTTARGGHTATLLINGKILIAGGEDGNSKSLSSAELYNPASGTFAATGSLNLARKGHTAGLLSNGMVLIAGGRDSRSVPTATAELYDPSTGTLFSTGNLNTPREYATATILNDGRVLIIGGQASFGILSSAELYDPAIGTFTATGSLNSARVYHTATLLNDGTVLVVGGQGATGTALATAELYDPSTGLFTATTANPNAARYLHTATLLNNGTVLISQGFDSSLNVLGSAELYDPANGTFTSTGSPNTPRNGASATLLGNGSVLLAGGYDSNLAGLLSAEAYDPATASFATIGNATTARRFHTATRLTNGNVLLAGGLDSSFTPLSTSELYQPATTAPAALVSIAVTPSNPSMSIGIAQRLIATGTFSNGSSQTLASVSWSSSDSAVATVTNDSTNSGSVYALATGSVTINACAGSTCGSATITVPSSQLTSIAITPANAVVVTGSSIAYFATGTYTNGGTQDLTAFVTWSSSSPSVATISATGVATSVSTGTTTITASYGGTSASVNLSVTKPISSISISPQNPSITVGATQQFSATATYTDGTTGNVTNIVQWATQAAQVATASVGGSVTAVGQGNTVVSASSGGVTRSTNLTVTAPILTISSVSPTSGVAGTQVSVSGSGFGNTQGTGMVWLGTVPGTVVSWSDTQVIATVAMGSSSGVTRIQQNGASSNSMPFTVITPLITSLNPTSAPVGTQVTIDGSGFGGVQGNGQVWLGTTAGAVSSWSDTQIVATVAAGSTSGNAQVLQNGVFSNSVPFAVTGGAPRITGITPNSGPVGTVVAIRGTGFGSQQSNGIAWIGGTYATVLQWSDSFIVATVATNAVSGVVKAQQNGLWSNGKAFKVTGMNSGSGAMTLNPTSVSMVVGDTRALQALDAGGQQVMGLPWSSSDTSLLTLSTDDPPVLTAIAPGTVTITAGSASADVTVYTGPALALGTTIWSNPGDGSGVSSIMPAVPSETGVADVFAINNSGNIQAIQADGRVAWTASVPVNDTPMYLPDFQGGMAILDRNQESIYKLDGMTGQRYPAYAPQNHDIGAPALHTDGTVIASDASFDPAMGNITSAWVTGIDPTIGQPKFQSPTPVSTSDLSVNGQVCQLKYPNRGQTSTFAIPSDPIIAGDGFAYSTYVTSHGQTQVDDAVQPYPLGAYTAFAQLSKDMPDQSGSGGDASAVIGDIALMKAILGLPPINFSHPSGIWDDMAVAVQNGNLSQANSDRAFEAPQFVPLCNVNSSGTTELHIVKVGSDGSSSDTLVKQWQTSGNTVYGRVPNNLWSYTTTQSGFQVPVFRYFITNADQGVMLSWEALQLAYCAASTDMGCTSNVNASAEYHLTSVPGGDAIMPAAVPYQNYPIQPVLQLEDGTYVGMVWSGTTPIAEFDPNNPFTSNGILFQGTPSMVKFDASGNILGVASGYIPQMATSDGGVIGSSYSTTPGSPFATPVLGPSTTFDANLIATGQSASLPTESWTSNAYQNGSVEQITFAFAHFAMSFAAMAAANPAANQTAIESTTDFFRRKIAQNATSHLGDTQTWNETNKPAQCNQFVHDVLAESFVNAPDVFHQRWKVLQVKVPAVAADWADETKGPDWQDPGDGSKPFKCWKVVAAGPDGAQPGDVLATGCNNPHAPGCHDPNDGTGHVGLIVDPTVVTSAFSQARGISVTTRLVSAASVAPWFWADGLQLIPPFQPGTVTLTDYGFRLVMDPLTYGNQGLKQYSHVRRYICY